MKDHELVDAERDVLDAAIRWYSAPDDAVLIARLRFAVSLFHAMAAEALSRD